MSSPSIKAFATCPRGLEECVAKELRDDRIGAADVVAEASGVKFVGDRATLYRANLWSRSGIRVLGRIARAPVRTPEDLYEWAGEIDWLSLMRLSQTFSVEARVWDSEITHSKYAALRVKDALCDQFRDRSQGRRPDVSVHGADLPLFLYIYKNVATLYRDWSGETLHKRGYRDVMHKSSLNEVVAASMLSLAEYDGGEPLIDPMCGSGTIPIEAALIAANRAPGLFREPGGFPFERWPDFDAGEWKSVREEAKRAATPDRAFRIAANDAHPGALSLARRDAARAGVNARIELSQQKIADYRPPFDASLVAVNPPWGERLGADALAAWRDLRLFLKEHCAPGTAWVLSGNADATRHMGLRASRKVPLRIGKIDCRILRYDILPPRDRAADDAAPRASSPWPSVD